ncbi:hypothetical protein ACCAA_450003 [Candidatus Accumulibacter aalborgensis]|uniref:Uncharacterized protein n=1 Tax=Candidatus Accumulibacter aalborgensis TaxID=1860102 RepID=A0A1A8XQZ3_9PROT|nr:hypothetical protein ACCAA_450003 [Candidatus Accumulibacter aalborgensis]
MDGDDMYTQQHEQRSSGLMYRVRPDGGQWLYDHDVLDEQHGPDRRANLYLGNGCGWQ